MLSFTKFFLVDSQVHRITVLALCLLLSTTARAPAQARPKDEAGIRSRVAAYEAAVNARDFPAIAQVFTPDADLVVFDAHDMSAATRSARRIARALGGGPPLGSSRSRLPTSVSLDRSWP